MGFGLVFLGVLGFVASLLALVLSSQRARFGPHAAAFAALLGVFTFGSGFVAKKLGERRVEEVAATVTDPALRAALIAEGEKELRGCVTVGFESGSMPLCAGLIAAIVVAYRRREGIDDDGSSTREN